MSHRFLLCVAALALICTGTIGCSETGPVGPSGNTTTIPADPALVAEFFRTFPPSATNAEEYLGGFMPEGFTVQGPGTVVVTADWTTTPQGAPARVVLMLFRANGATEICDSTFNGLCAGIKNVTGYEKPKEIRHDIGGGGHSFLVLVQSYGPASANITGKIRFERR